MTHTYRHTPRTRAFTLIELVVAVGLFGIVVVIATGAYLGMLTVSARAKAVTAGVDNLSFALDDMARTIRTSTSYSCNGGGTPQDCSSGADNMTVTTPNGPVQFRLYGNSIQQNLSNLTDPLSVNITNLRFYVTGTGANDGQQPHVTMVVQGSVQATKTTTENFSIETGATMRGTDLH